MTRRRRNFSLIVPLACLTAWSASRAGPARGDDIPGRRPSAADARAEPRTDRGATTWTTAVEPKPLSRQVRRGLEWLVEHQLPGGGWGGGEVSGQMLPMAGTGKPDVADTCIACLALIRSGSTPREGPGRGPIVQGVGYVCTQLEAPDPESLAGTWDHGTNVQMKLGPNIDSYLACLLLAEVKGHMPTDESEAVVDRTLDTVIGKIERHVMQDDPFDSPAWARALSNSVATGAPVQPVPLDLAGWEPILANAMCGRGLNRARQVGARVSDIALARAENAAWQTCKDLVGETRDIEPSSWVKVWQFARHKEQTSMLLHLNVMWSPYARSSPSMAVDADAAHAESPGRLTDDGSVAPSSPAGEATRDPESVDARMALRAARPTPHSSRTRRHTKAGRVAGNVQQLPQPVTPRAMMMIWKSAGAELYSWGSALGLLHDSVNTGEAEIARLCDQAAHSQDPLKRTAAEKNLARIAKTKKVQQEARSAAVVRLRHRDFLAGYGTNGGKECLSYMMIAESMAAGGGDTWRRWDSSMAAGLDRMQNGDGSWTGTHCIIGRTFCTSAALLTLMADRAPIPGAARYLIDRVRPDGSIDGGRFGMVYPVYSASASAIALTFLNVPGGRKARDAWLGELRRRQLTEELGWQPDDPAFGGWGYSMEPQSRNDVDSSFGPHADADLSSTLFAIGALRIAGVAAQDPAIHRALTFVERCQNVADDEQAGDPRFDDGGFFFTTTDPVRNKAGVAGIDRHGRTRYHSYGSATADGMRALLRCGLTKDHPRVAAARRWLETHFSPTSNPGTFEPARAADRDATYFYYAWSVAHAFRALGIVEIESDGRRIAWAEALADELIRRQRDDGTWSNRSTASKEDDPLVATPFAAGALANCRTVLVR